MARFLTADTHFDHANIVAHCDRPFADVDEMNETLARNWNETVGKRDDVYVLGDFAWKRHGYWLNALNGRIHLIVGNHDKMSAKVKECFSSAEYLRVIHTAKGEPTDRMLTMCHYAMKTWPSACHRQWHVYGHSHGMMPEMMRELSCDVGVDVWGYRPVPIEVVVRKMMFKGKVLDGERDVPMVLDSREAIRELNQRFVHPYGADAGEDNPDRD